MHSTLERLVDKWLKEEVKLNPGASERKLAAFEQDVGLSLPPDFRELYRLCDGMANHDSDLDLLSLWPLDRIRHDGGLSWHFGFGGVFVVFADAMLSAPEYALRIQRSGATSIAAPWHGLEDLSNQEFVAGSIAEFAAKHLAGKLPGPLYGD